MITLTHPRGADSCKDAGTWLRSPKAELKGKGAKIGNPPQAKGTGK